MSIGLDRNRGTKIAWKHYSSIDIFPNNICRFCESVNIERSLLTIEMTKFPFNLLLFRIFVIPVFSQVSYMMEVMAVLVYYFNGNFFSYLVWLIVRHSILFYSRVQRYFIFFVWWVFCLRLGLLWKNRRETTKLSSTAQSEVKVLTSWFCR